MDQFLATVKLKGRMMYEPDLEKVLYRGGKEDLLVCLIYLFSSFLFGRGILKFSTFLPTQ